MPTLESPGYYDHSKFIAAGRADAFFKWISSDWYMKETGSVESRIGWVGLIEVGRDVLASYITETGDAWASSRTAIDLGWYCVRQDDNGLVWGIGYGEGTLAEEGARADFAEAEKAYDEWWHDANPAPDLDDDEPEKLYLVGGCGEVFDDLRVAFEHCKDCEDCLDVGSSFFIVPESEAF